MTQKHQSKIYHYSVEAAGRGMTPARAAKWFWFCWITRGRNAHADAFIELGAALHPREGPHV